MWFLRHGSDARVPRTEDERIDEQQNTARHNSSRQIGTQLRVWLTIGAQPRVARDDLCDLGLRFARLGGCSALLAGAVEAFLEVPGRRAGTPLSMPSALRSSSTSGQ